MKALRFSDAQNLSNTQYVDQLYQNTFARAGDHAGHAFWTEQLDTAKLDRGDVLLGFSKSETSKVIAAPTQDGILLA